MSSLSSDAHPAMKKREAYRRYTILVSAREGQSWPVVVGAQLGQQRGVVAHTFVFEKVAHPGPSRQHELRDILDDLGLFPR